MAKKFPLQKEEKKENTRELGIRYLELILIFLVVILIAFFIRSWYRGEQTLKKEIPIIRGVIAEINTEELSTYLMENEDAIFYICSAEDKNCRSLEKELKKFIEDNNLQQDITYLNITNVKDKEEYFRKFNDTYQGKEMIQGYPSLVLFEDGVMKSSIQLTGAIDKMKEVENFLLVNRVIGE